MNTASTLEIYIDILFILNFIMDYIIFYLVAKFTNRKILLRKIIIGSILASLLYCAIIIVPFLTSLHVVVYLIFLPLLPIIIIFNPKSIREYIQYFILSNIIAFIIGGINVSMIYWIHGNSLDNITIYMLILSTIIAYSVIRINKYYMQKRNINIQKLYHFEITLYGETVNLEGLLDTGNKVYDPITKAPVIIVEYSALKKLLPKKIFDSYNKHENDVTKLFEKTNDLSTNYKFKIIPYHSLGNPHGLLLGFKPDSITVYNNKQKSHLTDNVIIGIYPESLVPSNKYTALLHSDVIS